MGCVCVCVTIISATGVLRMGKHSVIYENAHKLPYQNKCHGASAIKDRSSFQKTEAAEV